MRIPLLIICLATVLCGGCEHSEKTFSDSENRNLSQNAKAKINPTVKSSLQKTYFLKYDFGVMEEGEIRNCSLAQVPQFGG